MSLMILVFLLALVIVPPTQARTTGDPLDGNDAIQSETVLTDNPNCDDAERWPQCVPCWSRCMLALMVEGMLDGPNNWDW